LLSTGDENGRERGPLTAQTPPVIYNGERAEGVPKGGSRGRSSGAERSIYWELTAKKRKRGGEIESNTQKNSLVKKEWGGGGISMLGMMHNKGTGKGRKTKSEFSIWGFGKGGQENE